MVRNISETRTEDLTRDLLAIRGWDTARPPKGQTLRQGEYRGHPELTQIFAGWSKTGAGDAIPDFMLLSGSNNLPALVIEAKSDVRRVDEAIGEATATYGNACHAAGHPVVAVGIAGQDGDDFAVRVQRRIGDDWVDVSYENRPIGWIPNEEEVQRLLDNADLTDLMPSVPSPEVLAEKAELINRILREASVRDGQRPTYVGALMLAMWRTRGRLRKFEPDWILKDVNEACKLAFRDANKAELARSLHIDEENAALAGSVHRIIAELEKLNVVSASFSHDYLGQLYEAFFRYTGGNTIGQYFTPRHITRFMADLCQVTQHDKVLDPTCGTGGFLIAALNRAQEVGHLSYADAVEVVKHNLIGFESEPATAALCVANMILRGDGKSGIHRADVLTTGEFPVDGCDVGLMNPPFPHKNTDHPVQAFVERALEGIRRRGKLAILMPTSLLAKKPIGAWRKKILHNHTLLAVIELPDELFQPYAAATTSIVILEKGVPHAAAHQTSFVRVKHDGFALRKGIRALDAVHENQIPAAIEAVLNKSTVPGFAGLASITGESEWTAGAYVPSALPEPDELELSVHELMRRLYSFYVRYAGEIAGQRRAVEEGRLNPKPYRSMLSAARLANAAALPSVEGTIGGYFDVFYGQKELHSREGVAPGEALVISPTEAYNGCYGWLHFDKILTPGFVTVAQTGSIGEAFVQLEPCAVNDDCLILLPKTNQALSEAHLIIAAATIRLEKWRFNYGRKLTPARIAQFPLLLDEDLVSSVTAEVTRWTAIAESAVGMYAPREDAVV
ncbi:N-6 DNA methylase [Arthrobacter sp. TMN-37]